MSTKDVPNFYDLPDDAIVEVIQYLNFRQQFRLTMLNKATQQRMASPMNLITTKLNLSQVFDHQFFKISSTLSNVESELFAEDVLRNLLHYCGLSLVDLTVEVVSSSKQIFTADFFGIIADYCPNLLEIKFSMVHGLSPDSWYGLGKLQNLRALTVGKLISCNSQALESALQPLCHLRKLDISAPRNKDITWLTALSGCPIEEFKIGGTIDPAEPIRDFLISISGTLTNLALEIGWWTCSDYEWMGDLCRNLPNVRSLSVNYRTTVRTGAIYSSPRFANAFLENFKCKPNIRELFLGKGFARPDYVSAVGHNLAELQSLHLVITAGSWESHAAFMELRRLTNITTLILEGYKVDESIITLLLDDVLLNLKCFRLKGNSNATAAVIDSLAKMSQLALIELTLHSGSDEEVMETLQRFWIVRNTMLLNLGNAPQNLGDAPQFGTVTILLSCFANWDINRPLKLEKLCGASSNELKSGTEPVAIVPVKDKIGQFTVTIDSSEETI